jgi:uncharacterized protein
MRVVASEGVVAVAIALATISIQALSVSASSADLRLVGAVHARDFATARTLLRQKVEVNAAQSDGATALHWAIHWDNPEIVDLLLRAGADSNIANDYGVTPLLLACSDASASIVERLLKAGARPNTALPTGETPLMTAARTGKVEAVNALLAAGAIVDARESRKGQTALMWALAERHLDVVRTLLAHGADVKARSAGGFNPLLFGTREGDLETVRLLLRSGADADLNATSADGSSPLLVAVVRGHVALAKFLLDQGANPDADATGYTALHWAAGKWENNHTYDHPQIDAGEWGILGGVPPAEKLDLINALLARGADVNARTRKPPPRFGSTVFEQRYVIGATPFYLAALSADADVMRLLVARGADPVQMANDRTTPLIVASGITRIEAESRLPESEHLRAVELALDLGNDVNAANEAGNTALHGAAMAGFPSVVQALVDRGAALNAKNTRGETPLKLAAEGFVRGGQVNVRPAAAALLRKLGALLQ